MRPAQLLNNLRFYILGSAGLVSLLILSVLRLQTASDQLFYIRVEQIYGYVALVYWYVALLISPVSKMWKGAALMKQVLFARRAIGVAAAYFALLHVVVSIWGHIGGLDGLTLLPGRFVWSLIFGTVALLVLLAMAATSFDKVIKFMTYPRWKMLHRLGYIAGVLVLTHIWMVGTHLDYLSFRGVIFVLLVVLFGLESFRLAGTLAKKYPRLASRQRLLGGAIWIVVTLCLLLAPRLIGGYYDKHNVQRPAVRVETGIQ